MYSPQEIQLAQELAKGLDDQASVSFYLACTKKYSHRSLRKRLTICFPSRKPISESRRERSMPAEVKERFYLENKEGPWKTDHPNCFCTAFNIRCLCCQKTNSHRGSIRTKWMNLSNSTQGTSFFTQIFSKKYLFLKIMCTFT